MLLSVLSSLQHVTPRTYCCMQVQPLAFGITYCIARATGLSHRPWLGRWTVLWLLDCDFTSQGTCFKSWVTLKWLLEVRVYFTVVLFLFCCKCIIYRKWLKYPFSSETWGRQLHYTDSLHPPWHFMITAMSRYNKGKGKGRLWVLQHCCLEAYCTLTRMSSFIHLQRRCTHQAAWETCDSEGRNYTWNLASDP